MQGVWYGAHKGRTTQRSNDQEVRSLEYKLQNTREELRETKRLLKLQVRPGLCGGLGRGVC